VLHDGVIIEFLPRTSERDQAEGRQRLAQALRAWPAILDAYTSDEVVAGAAGDRPYFQAFRRSYYPGRSADVMIVPRENVLITNNQRETSHGSPHPYDTHVPLIFAGHGVMPGSHAERVRTVDIAPTLASLLGVRPIGRLDGEALEGVGSRE